MKTIASIGTLLALILYKPPKVEEETSGASESPELDKKGYTNECMDTQTEPQLSVQYENGDVMNGSDGDVVANSNGNVVDSQESTDL